jgi:hypothetical protein
VCLALHGLGGSSYRPHTSELIPDDEPGRDDEGNVAGPRVRLVAQKPSAEEIGEVEGKKGAVNSASSYRA